MTPQQLIDFWAEQIKKHESSAQFMSTTYHILSYKALADQARLIYMQLVQMDCEEPITFTAIDIPDDSFKGTVFSGLENISSVDPCQSDDPDDQCENCNCWKATRGNCS